MLSAWDDKEYFSRMHWGNGVSDVIAGTHALFAASGIKHDTNHKRLTLDDVGCHTSRPTASWISASRLSAAVGSGQSSDQPWGLAA